MKRMKKYFALAVAIVMVLALAAPALATEGENPDTPTINGPDTPAATTTPPPVQNQGTGTLTINGAVSGKTYDLYRVMDLTFAGGSASSTDDNAYSYTISTEFAGFTYNDVTYNKPAAGEKDAFATYLETLENDSDALSNLAEALLQWAVDHNITPAKTVEATGTSATASDLYYGYYLMNPRGGSEASGNFATMFSLNTLSGEDTTIVVKAVYPTIEKKVADTVVTEPADADTPSIGEELTFTLTTKVPELAGYDWYKIAAKDHLSKGLTYTGIKSVKIGTYELKETEYTVLQGTYSSTNGTDIAFVIEDLVAGATATTPLFNEGDDIVIQYTAELNGLAVINDTGNPNTVSVVYTNNPQYTHDHENTTTPPPPDGGDPTDPLGEIPEGESETDDTNTLTTELNILKTDGSAALPGAQFTLTGTRLKQVLIKTGTTFVADENGTYWKLVDGTYTTNNPAETKTVTVKDENGNDKEVTINKYDAAMYDSTTTKYSKAEYDKTTTTDEGAAELTTSAVAYVDGDGKLTFSGLGVGTYTLSETVVPAGYNAIADMTITVSYEDGAFKFKNGTTNLEGDTLTVVNQSGVEMPSTGGIGTTIFYVAGSILVVAAVVFFVTKKRVSA